MDVDDGKNFNTQLNLKRSLKLIISLLESNWIKLTSHSSEYFSQLINLNGLCLVLDPFDEPPYSSKCMLFFMSKKELWQSFNQAIWSEWYQWIANCGKWASCKCCQQKNKMCRDLFTIRCRLSNRFLRGAPGGEPMRFAAAKKSFLKSCWKLVYYWKKYYCNK